MNKMKDRRISDWTMKERNEYRKVAARINAILDIDFGKVTLGEEFRGEGKTTEIIKCLIKDEKAIVFVHNKEVFKNLYEDFIYYHEAIFSVQERAALLNRVHVIGDKLKGARFDEVSVFYVDDIRREDYFKVKDIAKIDYRPIRGFVSY
ncbi:hypothetical protein [Jeotgalibaca arthritidis]|uniref:hypothetical protein n=1 Tax=Jeotgalibaca arthritidis TaxID=1868794 RepID=UPI0035A02D38